MLGERGHETESDVRRGTDLEGDRPFPNFGHEVIIIEDADAVAQPLGADHVDGTADAGGALGLAGVMDAMESLIEGGVEHVGERLDRIRLVAGQTDPDDAAVHVRRRQLDRAPGPLDGPAPGVVQQHGGLEPVAGPSLGQAVEHRLERHGHVADSLAVGGGGEGDLGVAGAVGGLVLAELDGDAAKILGPLQARTDEVVLLEEVGEAAEGVGAVDEVMGDRDPVDLRRSR